MSKTYVDEIIGGDGKRRYNLVDDDGNIVIANVQIQKAYTPTQEGTAFGAEDIAGLVQTSNIIDDLTHADTAKPLSANQGKVLKALIDSIKTKKLLWAGAWNTGTISVPDFDKYSIFQFHLSGAGGDILISKEDIQYISGAVGFISADTLTFYNYIFSGTYSGTTLTRNYSGVIAQTIATAAMTKTAVAVTKIYGII